MGLTTPAVSLPTVGEGLGSVGESGASSGSHGAGGISKDRRPGGGELFHEGPLPPPALGPKSTA